MKTNKVSMKMLEYLILTFQCRLLFHISQASHTKCESTLGISQGFADPTSSRASYVTPSRYLQNDEGGTTEARCEFLQAFIKYLKCTSVII